MSSENQSLSTAITYYTGYGKENHPGEYPERLVGLFGQSVANRLTPIVESILADLNSLKPDWPTLSLVQAGKWAKDQMHIKYPDLNSDALDALEWTFTWWWK